MMNYNSMSLHFSPYMCLQEHAQARACISALSKSHVTNAAPLLNSLRRTIPKYKQKFDKTGRKKSTRVCVGNLNFYLPC